MSSRQTPNLDLCTSTEVGMAYIDSIFTGIALLQGPPRVGFSSLYEFSILLDDMLDCTMPYTEAVEWFEEFRRWHTKKGVWLEST